MFPLHKGVSRPQERRTAYPEMPAAEPPGDENSLLRRSPRRARQKLKDRQRQPRREGKTPTNDRANGTMSRRRSLPFSRTPSCPAPCSSPRAPAGGGRRPPKPVARVPPSGRAVTAPAEGRAFHPRLARHGTAGVSPLLTDLVLPVERSRIFSTPTRCDSPDA